MGRPLAQVRLTVLVSVAQEAFVLEVVEGETVQNVHGWLLGRWGSGSSGPASTVPGRTSPSRR
ncbi:hypothetical protein DV701_08615 [Ornithinimicrobium avium]|uniref:Uncharacterized protein n=1 Tax=Ornithinimicrobium avium TaxID=2283195 RepID=A0A345NMC8_9MICO|nr:hypothetical protein DV701_08615 [Ornithinimicrobium avium]